MKHPITTPHTAPPDAPQLLIATLGALLVGVLYLALPEEVSLGPRWLLVVVEAVLLAPALLAVLLARRSLPFRMARSLALGLLAVLTAALVSSLALLVAHIPLLTHGGELLRPAALLWGINVLVFAVWYWEIDGDGPVKRHLRAHEAADFLFPQQVGGNTKHWRSGFIDYLFLAFCFSTALSPADTPPITRRGKLLMMAQALISLLIIVLLVARSVNIIA